MANWNPGIGGTGGRPDWAHSTPQKRGSDGTPRGVPDDGETPMESVTISVRKDEKFLEIRRERQQPGVLYQSFQAVMTSLTRADLLSLQVRNCCCLSAFCWVLL